MIQSIENGGLKLVDFESKVESLKLGKRENGEIRQQNFTKLMIWIITSNVTESQVISETNSMNKHSIIGANFKKSESQR